MVHEAGHAVAAIENGIPFRAVVLYDRDSVPVFYGGQGYALGAVEMCSSDPTTWVQPALTGSLNFAFAGAAAEQAVLGHKLPGGWEIDFDLWRKGLGMTAGQTTGVLELDEIIGGSFFEVVKETDSWASGAAERIVPLAEHLAQQDAPFEMSHDEVQAFLQEL